MYLHLLSPSRFHHYTWDNRTRAFKEIFGLEHRHFPLAKLLSGEWCPKRTHKVWNEWNSPDGTLEGPNLPYQLWPSAPWESTKRQSGIFSRILSRNADRPSSSGQKWTSATNATVGQQPPPRVIIMHQWNRCRTTLPTEGYKVWDVESYTRIRTCRREERCRSQSQHEQFDELCGLQPWPCIQDLRQDLERQIPFWKVMMHVKNSIPGFTQGLNASLTDYEQFLELFSGVLPKHGRVGLYSSKLDPKAAGKDGMNQSLGNSKGRPTLRFNRLLPPTLEIDLLWQTHRLFPAKYWIWSSNKADWVIEMQPIETAASGNVLLEYTKELWKERTGVECPETTNSVDQWFTEYVPAAAKHASKDAEKADITTLILGHNATRQRRKPWKRGGGADMTGGGGAGDYGGGGGDGGGGGE